VDLGREVRDGPSHLASEGFENGTLVEHDPAKTIGREVL
jgi:hypothetical protein